MGIEEEFMRNYECALDWYEKSVKLLEEHAVNNPKLMMKFQKAYETAKSVRIGFRKDA